jgi:hypothetical protein
MAASLGKAKESDAGDHGGVVGAQFQGWIVYPYRAATGHLTSQQLVGRYAARQRYALCVVFLRSPAGLFHEYFYHGVLETGCQVGRR